MWFYLYSVWNRFRQKWIAIRKWISADLFLSCSNIPVFFGVCLKSHLFLSMREEYTLLSRRAFGKLKIVKWAILPEVEALEPASFNFKRLDIDGLAIDNRAFSQLPRQREPARLNNQGFHVLFKPTQPVRLAFQTVKLQNQGCELISMIYFSKWQDQKRRAIRNKGD